MKFNFDYEPQDLYKLFDYETIEVLAKVRTINGIYIVQTKLDMFVIDRELGIDPDLFEVIPDEPIYIFRGINKWDKEDWEIQEVLEVLEWKL